MVVRVGVVVVVLGSVTAPVAVAQQCAAPVGVHRDAVGWAQRLVAPERIWPLADGTGQTVAVVGTGVDAANGQFGAGQVVADLGDCDGRSTFAAGIVAARPDPTTTFVGVAPGAKILSVRYTSPPDPDPDRLAEGVTRALAEGATVILVAVPVPTTSGALDAAVRDALARNVVVVSSAVGQEPGARSYPAALPGVVAVGAVDRAGAAVQGESGDHVSLAAPGADLVSVSAGTSGIGHRWGVGDPAHAAAYVAGTVALLRSYRPGLDARQVLARLTVTAARPPGGGHDPRRGWGVLDAYAAVTAELAADAQPRAAAPPRPGPDAAPVVAPGSARSPDRLPGILSVVGILVAGLVAVVVAEVRRGRARRRRA